MDGFCKEDCGNNLWIYALVICFASILGNMSRIGNSIVSFRYDTNNESDEQGKFSILLSHRIVEPQDKSLAIGIAEAFMCIFGRYMRVKIIRPELTFRPPKHLYLTR